MRKVLPISNNIFFALRKGFSELNKFQNSFLTTTNLSYIESLYEKWVVDKNSVSKSFAAYFELLEQGQDPQTAYQKPTGAVQHIKSGQGSTEIINQIKMRLMIDSYRSVGHQFAKVDPLNLSSNKNVYGRLDESVLSAQVFGYKSQNLNQKIVLKNLRDQANGADNGPYTIQQFQNFLKNVYCDKVGFEYMHILDKAERDFIKIELEQKVQSLQKKQPSKQDQLQTLHRLAKDQSFIDFLGKKFGNFKRFGIEGINSATTALGQLVQSAASLGVQNIQFGMAHRGRLNALHCIFDKKSQQIFREFLQKKNQEDQGNFSGDVKYHLGYVTKKKINGKDISLEILPNPSHLEAVNPLVYGSTRAIQQFKRDNAKQKAFGVLIHGDAAVSGQGVVFQSLGFQDLSDYSTGGIIHIVLNNQIGFTTHPSQSRSSYYCTQIAKAVDAPVIHVNGDEPDILDMCMKIAVAYRQKFKKDIFIDIIGYRRHGHNEQDMPNFTQPLMYEKINAKKSVFETYSNKLVSKGVISQKQIDTIYNGFVEQYEQDYKKVMSDSYDKIVEEELQIKKIKTAPKTNGTGVSKNILGDLFHKITTCPPDFHLHPTIKKIYDQRIKNFQNNQPLDWATMQSLSYATLLNEGYSVRLSGEDVERGTFSHRHAYVSDQKRDVEKYSYLKVACRNNATITVSNSHLSEYGVMGFEYGYSITNPNSLVIWEAQFGDFANGAAIIIDNFLVSGETKWEQQSGLVLSLPHGMDGQGPQHSQGRIQRFLQLSDDNTDQQLNSTYEQQLKKTNIQVVCVSTTSNYFHAMRRQIHRNYRKPLIMFNSKKLLKFKGANSPISNIDEGTNFVSVYGDQDPLHNPSKTSKILICHGQFYYDLKAKRQQLKRHDVAIIRIEELSPFPHQALKKILDKYDPKIDVFWVQEQHENYGVWNFIYPRLKLLLKKPIGFYGRPASAATAVGALKLHKKQEEALLNEIFAV